MSFGKGILKFQKGYSLSQVPTQAEVPYVEKHRESTSAEIIRLAPKSVLSICDIGKHRSRLTAAALKSQGYEADYMGATTGDARNWDEYDAFVFATVTTRNNFCKRFPESADYPYRIINLENMDKYRSAVRELDNITSSGRHLVNTAPSGDFFGAAMVELTEKVQELGFVDKNPV